MLSRLVVPFARVFASITRKCLAFLGLDANFATVLARCRYGHRRRVLRVEQ
jgi:hypothetical protein